ncbi:hypothetical protein KHA94_04550 [Bacillus sp. FJAT-49705]|uniref:Uncharacterized protein n=1 Tax=Cytobacillus citreus TaxID=2833586 RepID=A0ABS5NNS6_9BACI|nr:hypothetical protein [Cytobacillus citreus]MBS4189487.1 hypothetical protein [Cytobacillus citreus]
MKYTLVPYAAGLNDMILAGQVPYEKKENRKTKSEYLCIKEADLISAIPETIIWHRFLH